MQEGVGSNDNALQSSPAIAKATSVVLPEYRVNLNSVVINAAERCTLNK